MAKEVVPMVGDIDDLLLEVVAEDAADVEEQKRKKVLRGGVLHLVQNLYNPRDLEYERYDTGQLVPGCPRPKVDAVPLLTRERVELAVKALEPTKEIAWIYHDKDVYTKADEVSARKVLANHPDRFWLKNVREGEPKPPHFHVVMRSQVSVSDNGVNRRSGIRVDTIAKAFGVPENQIKICRGRNAFAAQLAYLPHLTMAAKRAGKHQYDYDEVSANFEWQELADRHILNTERRYGIGLKTGKWAEDLDPEAKDFESKFWTGMIRYEGWTLARVKDRVPVLYMMNEDKFEKARSNYLAYDAPMPKRRINYLITGGGGTGKSFLARGLARTLYPNRPDEETFYIVGAPGVRFQHYNGQPVIIWSDMRAVSFVHEFSRERFFEMFDTAPQDTFDNKKFGSVRLINEVNIVCTVEDYSTFLNGIAGEYTDRYGEMHRAEDTTQSYRRFPLIIPIEIESYKLGMSMGFLDKEREFAELFWTNSIRYSIKDIMGIFGDEHDAVGAFYRVASPIVEATNQVVKRLNGRDMPSFETPDVPLTLPEGATDEDEALLLTMGRPVNEGKWLNDSHVAAQNGDAVEPDAMELPFPIDDEMDREAREIIDYEWKKWQNSYQDTEPPVYHTVDEYWREMYAREQLRSDGFKAIDYHRGMRNWLRMSKENDRKKAKARRR